MRAPHVPRPVPRPRSLLGAALLAAVVAGLSVVALARPAGAGGGDVIEPVRDRYAPGETATMVGYTSAGAWIESSGLVEDGPYYGHLRADPEAALAGTPDWPAVHPTDVPLGPTTVTETGRRDQFAVRLSITFTVPSDLAPGTYEVFVCNDPCTRTLGQFVGGALNVGVEAADGVDRNWLIDDPAIALLDDDRVAGVTVGDIRAGRAGTPWYDQPFAPPPTVSDVGAGPTGTAGARDDPAARTGDGQRDPVRLPPPDADAAASARATERPDDSPARDVAPVVGLVAAAVLVVGAAAARRHLRSLKVRAWDRHVASRRPPVPEMAAAPAAPGPGDGDVDGDEQPEGERTARVPIKL
jgi:hypothetical protein